MFRRTFGECSYLRRKQTPINHHEEQSNFGTDFKTLPSVTGHSGLEHVLSLIRERFWIIGARNTLKEILRRCVDNRRRQAAVGEQKMADLPEHRVTPDKPPFTFVGVDCFGPFLIKRA